MFDIGFTELLLLAVIALLVLGPERLPEAARTAGLLLGRLRRGFESIRTEVQRELHAEEMRQKLEEERRRIGLDDIRQSIEDAVSDKPPTPPADDTPADRPPDKNQAPPP